MRNIIQSLFFQFLLLLTPTFFFGQNIQFNSDLNIIYEQTVASDTDFHFTVKPFTQKDFSKFKQFDTVNLNSKIFYSLLNKDLLNVSKNNFSFILNPLIQSQAYYDVRASSLFMANKIGVSINSSYKNKVFFNSNLYYSVLNLPDFQKTFADSFGIIPHYGKFLSANGNQYSILSFSGEITYQPSEYIYFHVGKGNHFLGNGYRSLFLSDNTNSYPYFKTTVDIWKIKYFWLIAGLNDFELYNSNQEFDLYKKAAFIHYFSLNITKRINFNFFEAIISNPYDIHGDKNGYEPAYFNPVIFYRPVEFYTGTTDNSLMGIGINLRLFKSLHLYSQFILDDLIVSKLKDGSGWWGNKIGIQVGLKAYNFFNVEGLFFRGELNVVRPYTYSHGISTYNSVQNLNYGDYHQSLAHPLGANFAEAISVISYNKGRFMTTAKIILSKSGVDNDSISYGSDIYKAYNLRPDDYGIKFLQGEITGFSFIDINVSYLINPNYNLKFEIGVYNRTEMNSFVNNSQTVLYLGLSSRLFNEQPDN